VELTIRDVECHGKFRLAIPLGPRRFNQSNRSVHLCRRSQHPGTPSTHFTILLTQQAGALLAAGIMSSQVHDENDPALALLAEFVQSEKPSHRITSIMGLGIAYSGSNRDDLKDLFLPIITDTSLDTVVSATAAFALGQIFLGQGAKPDNEIAPAMAQALLEMPPEQLSSPWMRFYILGLALLFFGKQDASDAFVETLKTIEHPIAQEAIVMLTMCSFAGTGEVLRIQQMLRLCAEKMSVRNSF